MLNDDIKDGIKNGVNDVLKVKIVPTAAFGDLPLPRYESALAAGLDVCACIDEPVTLAPGERRLIPTGLKLAIPAGYEGQVRPRSGLALKHGITVLNSPGTIDADYRGELGVILINLGEKHFEIERGMRIAQLVFARVAQAELVRAVVLDETERGAGGFGHSGV